MKRTAPGAGALSKTPNESDPTSPTSPTFRDATRMSGHAAAPVQVTTEHMTAAAVYLGGNDAKNLLYTSGHQAFVLSHTSQLSKLRIHPINRPINPAWVTVMKDEIKKNASMQELMTLHVAVDVYDVQRYLQCDPDEEPEPFCAWILDGQHRLQAMKELAGECPILQYNVMLIVYITQNDQHFRYRLETLNKRREFNAADVGGVDARTRFMYALGRVVGEHMGRQCVARFRTKVTEGLRDDAVIKRLGEMTEEQMLTRLKAIGESYRLQRWDAHVAENAKNRTNAFGKTVAATGLYQMLDQGIGWMKEM